MYIDLIPPELYTPPFHYSILCLIVLALIQCEGKTIYQEKVARVTGVFVALYAILLIFYMGLRPVSHYFGDTVNYANSFKTLQESYDVDWIKALFSFEGEWLFNGINHFGAEYADIHFVFLVCAFIYVGATAAFCMRVFKVHWWVPFVITCSMFEFWSYGVNGVRNGAASSLVILALSYVNNLPMLILFALLGLGMHKSLLLILACALLAKFVTNTKWYMAGWLGCVAISAAFGQRISDFVATSGVIDDERLAKYASFANDTKLMSQFSHTGFRPDFLLYSALPIAVGYFFIYRKNFTDPFYRWFLNIYIAANGFWVLMMHAHSSNRFAQLSWFLMGIVLIYPFFKQRFWHNQEYRLLLYIMLIYAFSFYRNIFTPFFTAP